MQSAPATAAFALLDDATAPAGAPRSRLYQRFVREHRCDDPHELDAVLAAVQADLAQGLHALLLADYEWGVRLQGVALAPAMAPAPGALRVLLFAHCVQLGAPEVDAWLQQQEGGRAEPGPAGVQALQTRPEPAGFEAWFEASVARIQEAIRCGETYQVNHTYALQGQAYGSPVGLYRRLRERQPAAYGALIALPDDAVQPGAPRWVLSCSPELFLRHAAGHVTAQPMKGTAPRVAGDTAADQARAQWLRHDAKNRAENLMIVDLLRNDLGRIARVGSVQVPQLFDVAAHGTVWQMTSTVQAEVAASLGLADLLRATFPCGSITGAPKRRTMEWIERLEAGPRGLYTGAIGWLEAPADGRACGDFCLSVVIRTLTLADDPSGQGLRPAHLGVGAGIVLDSEAGAELAECRLKASFLTGLDPGFELFETLFATREAGARAAPQHLARLGASATLLGFGWSEAAAQALLAQTVRALPPGPPHRLRLALRHDGSLHCTAAVLDPLPGAPGTPADPVDLLLAAEPVRDQDTPVALRRHKTSLRRAYDAGVQQAVAAGAFDTLYCSAEGWLTEGARSNVFVRLDGRWWTPPVGEGLLPGVQRAQVLADPAWLAGERRIHRDELARAEGWLVCNALRGTLHARLRGAAAPARQAG